MTTALATPTEPVIWVDLFQALFHANTPAWGQTLFAWGQLFHAEGRSNSELTSAVRALTRRSPMPNYPTEFLAALRAELRAQDESVRQQAEARRCAEITRPIRCTTCGDSGWCCGLPALESVRGPEWIQPRWTCAVTCHCEAGQILNSRWATRQPEPKPVMSWHDYAKRNPHYEAQMETRRLEVAAEVMTAEQEDGPPEWRATVNAILSRYGQDPSGGQHPEDSRERWNG